MVPAPRPERCRCPNPRQQLIKALRAPCRGPTCTRWCLRVRLQAACGGHLSLPRPPPSPPGVPPSRSPARPRGPGAQHVSRSLQQLLAARVLPSLRGAVSSSPELLAVSEVSLVCYSLGGTCPALRGGAQVCRMAAPSQEQFESWTRDKLFPTCSCSFPWVLFRVCPFILFYFFVLFLWKNTVCKYKNIFIRVRYINIFPPILLPTRRNYCSQTKAIPCVPGCAHTL